MVGTVEELTGNLLVVAEVVRREVLGVEALYRVRPQRQATVDDLWSGRGQNASMGIER